MGGNDSLDSTLAKIIDHMDLEMNDRFRSMMMKLKRQKVDIDRLTPFQLFALGYVAKGWSTEALRTLESERLRYNKNKDGVPNERSTEVSKATG